MPKQRVRRSLGVGGKGKTAKTKRRSQTKSNLSKKPAKKNKNQYKVRNWAEYNEA